MQVLELIFAKEDGKTVVFSIDTPITRKKGARLIEKNVSEVPITL
ncbi:hypothetical protein ACIQ61_21620 [Bacillus cereus]